MAAPSTGPVCKPIVVGSIAQWLGKQADDTCTHEWHIYVRALNGDEDPSQYISRVVFGLHPTLTPPTRVLTSPPFEVTDKGWGEFEVHIQIHFHGSTEKPLELTHMLKLYPEDSNAEPSTSTPVVSEHYDEVIFNEPSDDLRARLAPQPTPSPSGWRNNPLAKWYQEFDPEGQTQQLQQVYQQITAQLQNASKRRVQCEDDLRALRTELAQLS